MDKHLQRELQLISYLPHIQSNFCKPYSPMTDCRRQRKSFRDPEQANNYLNLYTRLESHGLIRSQSVRIQVGSASTGIRCSFWYAKNFENNLTGMSMFMEENIDFFSIMKLGPSYERCCTMMHLLLSFLSFKDAI